MQLDFLGSTTPRSLSQARTGMNLPIPTLKQSVAKLEASGRFTFLGKQLGCYWVKINSGTYPDGDTKKPFTLRELRDVYRYGW